MGNFIEQYIKKLDWRVKENSNMNYSLQGLNNYISSAITSEYWLNEVYTPDIKAAHKNGDIHIHDLGLLSAYCIGWSLEDLLKNGFAGVTSKAASAPAKHFRTALGQIANFLYTLQGEAAGAQAFSNFDTLLAPFVHYDNLTYGETKQALQEFIFNMNVPTRVGFQCMSEDTEILTEKGWKGHGDIAKDDVIATFNKEDKTIEYQRVNFVYAEHYKGKMHRIHNRDTDQLLSPGHRVVRKAFNTDKYTFTTIEDCKKLKSGIAIPKTTKGVQNKHGVELSDLWIELFAWILTDGTLGSKKDERITIYQSAEKHPEYYQEILNILNMLQLKCTIKKNKSEWGTIDSIRLNLHSSAIVRGVLFPDQYAKVIKRSFITMINNKQAKLFLKTYLKGDGDLFASNRRRTSTVLKNLVNDLAEIGVIAGFTSSTELKKKEQLGPNNKRDLYHVTFYNSKDLYIAADDIVENDYSGIIWCPNTKNETVIARRKGKVFITGNTPFSNLTMDLCVPEILKDQPIIHKGVNQDVTYSNFQSEMDMINRAFAEIMTKGDADGRPFSFPIPTYNITKDFDWDNPNLEAIWEMTKIYGIPYFSNFVSSDLDPDDVRSMCPLDGKEKILFKSSRYNGLEYSEIKNLYAGSGKNKKYEIYSNGEFIKGTFNKFLNQKMISVTLENNHKIKMGEGHLNYVFSNNKEQTLQGKDLTKDMYLPYSLNIYKGEGGNCDFGYFVGAYAGGGSFNGDDTIVFSLNGDDKKEVITELKRISKDYFGANHTVASDKKTKLIILRIHSKVAVGLCKDFVTGEERKKHYRPKLFETSVEFRNSIFAGHYAINGGNNNRIYTSSPKMVESLNLLAATLGTTTSVYKNERGGGLGTEPNYSVLTYELNREEYGKIWFKKNGKLWIKIKKIEKAQGSVAYCFEVEAGVPIFTVGTTGILTHNCRLRLDNKELRKRGGGLFGANPLTGSIGVVTINLPRIGHVAKTKSEFFNILEEKVNIAFNSLVIKRKILEELTNKDFYPYTKFYLRETKKRFGLYWKNHFSTIGIIGMNEACLNLGLDDIGGQFSHKFALNTMDFIRDIITKMQEKTGDMFNLEGVPAEGASYRLTMLDKKEFPKIICANEKDYQEGAAPYYTNSTQLPVNYTDDIYETLSHQEELQAKYTGGTVLHIFLGEKIQDTKTIKSLLKKITKFKVPYFTITPTFSICPSHGYLNGKQEKCSICNKETEVYSRVVGYLRPIKQWNNGKQAEEGNRKMFNVKSAATT